MGRRHVLEGRWPHYRDGGCLFWATLEIWQCNMVDSLEEAPPLKGSFLGSDLENTVNNMLNIVFSTCAPGDVFIIKMTGL